MRPGRRLDAGSAFSASIDSAGAAQEMAGERKRRRALADCFGADEEQRVVEGVPGDRLPEHGDHAILAEDLGELEDPLPVPGLSRRRLVASSRAHGWWSLRRRSLSARISRWT